MTTDIVTPITNNTPPSDFDGPWKRSFVYYFDDFMEFCLPHIAEQIDWPKGCEHRGEATLLTRLLEHRFCPIPTNYLELIQQANADTILIWGKRVLDAGSLEEIFINAAGEKA